MTLSRPKVAKVTVEIEQADGERLRYTYLADFPDREPDPASGIELEVTSEVRRAEELYRQLRTMTDRYTATFVIDKPATWTLEHLPPARPALDGRLTVRSERADETEPLAIEAATQDA